MEAPDCEFGLELIGVLPALYARAVDRTVSLEGTAPFYHWSPAHTEVRGTRRSSPFQHLSPHVPDVQAPRQYSSLTPASAWPISSLHTCSRTPPSSEVWSPPPMVTPARAAEGRRIWAAFGRTSHTCLPPVIVHNKICDEWGTGSVHRIPDAQLAELADTALSHGRRLLYVRPTGDERGFTRDHNLISPGACSDFRTVDAHGGITLQAAMEAADLDYNTAQVLLSCTTDEFVSVQGGAAIVASYFGGANFVYARKGVEVDRRLYAPDSLVPALSGARLTVVDTAPALAPLLHERLGRRNKS